jgi:signal transduction histidine kinase
MSVDASTQSPAHVVAEPWSFKLLAWVLLAAVTAAIATLMALATDSPEWGWSELVAWALLVSAASLIQLPSESGPTLSMDLPILLGAGFVHGPVFAGLVGLAGSFDPRELRREVSVSRALLNRAQVALSAMVAAAVFVAIGGELGNWPMAILAALAALTADGLANHSTVALATSLLRRQSVSDVFSRMYLGAPLSFIAIYGCFGFLGLLLAETHARLGLIGVAAFVAPVVLARQLFFEWRHLNEARSSLRAKSDALRDVDERIAEERHDERVRIASSLHDDVLQCLYNVTIRTHVIKEDLRLGRLLDLDDDVPALLDASERAVEELRDVIRDLRKSAVGHAGLVETLGLLITHLRDESGVMIVPSLERSLKTDASTELLVYQIAREAMTNSIKHASPRTIWITLSDSDGSILLSVTDDGVGFDTSRAPDDRHFGIELMKERAAMLDGHLEITSQPGVGTTVSLRAAHGGAL